VSDDDDERERLGAPLQPSGVSRRVPIRLGRRYQVVLERPRARILQLEDVCFGTDRCVLLPALPGATDHDIEESRGQRDGLAVVAATLAFAQLHPTRFLLVAGHTDSVGAKSYNLDLSERRAHNVRLYLEGDRASWAAHADAQASKSDRDHVRAWAKQVLEIEDVEQAWASIYDLYDQHLASILRVPTEDLAKLREDLTFTDPASIGCGEEFPVEAFGVDGHACADNRRVDVLFFDRDELPGDLGGDPPGAAVYGPNRYKPEYIPVGALGGAGRADFELLLELRDHYFVEPVASKPYEIRGPLPERTHVRTGTTDQHGRLREAELAVGEYLVLCDGGFTVAGSRLTEILRRDVAPDVHRLHGYDADTPPVRSVEYADPWIVLNAGAGDFIAGPLAEDFDDLEVADEDD
jgi:hypothetical protein